jgi:hypothetical protein
LFDKYEEKEVTKDEASDLSLSKTGSVVKKLDNGNYLVRVKVPKEELKRRAAEKKAAEEEAKKQKALAKLEETKKEITDKPPEGQIPERPTSALEEESIGEFVNFEIGKEKNGKRVTVFRGRIKVRPDRFGRLRNKFLFEWDKGGYYVNLAKLIEVEVKRGMRKKTVEKVRKLVYDIRQSEPLEQNGEVVWDDELEEILTDAGAGQYIDAASQEGGFQLTPQLLKMLILVGVLGGFLGLALNGVAHFTPITQVHWVP